MVVVVTGDERSATKSECIDRDVIGDKWQDIETNGVILRKQRREKRSVRIRCLNAV